MKATRLAIYALLLLVLTIGFASALPVYAQVEPFELTDPATGVRPFEDQELRIINTEAVPILAYEHEILDAMYEEASGVTLDYTNVAYPDLLPQLQTMCASGGDDYDIMFVEDGWAGALIAQGCIEDLKPYYMAAPGDAHPEDFPLRAFGTVAMHNEMWTGMPTLVAVGMLAYRTDLFNDPDEQAAFQEQYGRELALPTTWQEYLEVGQFFTRPDESLYGFNHRYGGPNNIYSDFVIFFGYARGYRPFARDFTPTINSSEGIEALSFFTSQDFLNAQPPGRESFQFGEVMQNMAQCQVALYATENWSIPLLLDPETSACADNIAFARAPGWLNPDTGEIVYGLLSAGPGYVINANISPERKQLAWDYLQLAHGQQWARVLAEQTGTGHRTSILTDPELVEQYPHLAVNYEAMQVGIGRPGEPWWPQAEFVIGTEMGAVVAGTKTVEQALNDAQAQVEQIVADAGYNDGSHTWYSTEDREQFACDLFAEIGVEHPDCGE